jgi:ABC-2 type transport system ATP-binding protein
LGLELVGLTARAQTALGRLSELERRRVHLARALLADPELLLIDQPDSDPSDPERKSSETELHEILRDLSGLGKTVVIAAARWSEVASLCSQRLNLDRGRVTGSHKTGATQQLSLFPRSGPSVAPSAGKRLKLWTEQPTPILVELLRRQPQVLDVETLADGSHVIHHNGDDAFMPDLLRRLIGAGIDVKGLENVNLPQAAVSSERDDKGNA